MTRRVLVTGASGFVGQRLVLALARDGWHVYALTSRPERVPRVPGVEVIQTAWRRAAFDDALARVTDAALWVHAAAAIDFSTQADLQILEANALLVDVLATAAARCATRPHVVLLSTVSVYGASQELDTRIEPYPESLYGMSKLLAERLVEARLGTQCAILRLAGVWGREENAKLFVNRCILSASQGHSIVVQGSGSGRRNYLWVGDVPTIVARAFDERWHGVRIAAGPDPMSIGAMAEKIGDHFNVPVEYGSIQETASERDSLAASSPDVPATPFGSALAQEIGTLP